MPTPSCKQPLRPKACSQPATKLLQGKDEVAAVGVMAPAVKQTLQSTVNPLLHLDGVRLNPGAYRASVAKFFNESFPQNVDVHLVGANNVSPATWGHAALAAWGHTALATWGHTALA